MMREIVLCLKVRSLGYNQLSHILASVNFDSSELLKLKF
jgi:hypothetical protein